MRDAVRNVEALLGPQAAANGMKLALDLPARAVPLIADPVEMEGVRRARQRAAGADLVLWVTDACEGEGAAKPDLDGAVGTVPVWRVRNKADLVRSMNAAMLRTMEGDPQANTGPEAVAAGVRPGSAAGQGVATRSGGVRGRAQRRSIAMNPGYRCHQRINMTVSQRLTRVRLRMERSLNMSSLFRRLPVLASKN